MRSHVGLVLILAAALFASTAHSTSGDEVVTLNVSPDVVDVGLNFAGDDVRIYGTALEGTEVVVKVDGPTDSVKLNKQGKVLGLFWMTVDQAEIEDMPSFHLVRSSAQIDKILSWDEQVRLGVDPMLASIMSQARAVSPGEEDALSESKTSEFVAGLRDIYIGNGLYTPCTDCHDTPSGSSAVGTDATPPTGGLIDLEDGRWEMLVSLPWDAPLGDYTVESYCVRDGQMVGLDSTTFTVRKVGLVDSLGTMANENGVLYGAMSLGIIIAVGMVIGFVFPRGRGGH